MHAYDEAYLNDAMINLGDAFEYATIDCQIDKDKFFQLFIATGIADEFGNGNPSFLAGMSGVELVKNTLKKSGNDLLFPIASEFPQKTSTYWCGWILAYYQWFTAIPFRDISRYITMSELENLYPTLHEAPEDKFVDVLNAIIHQKPHPTKLQILRKNIDMTQKELADASGVSLRSIQMYEQRNKDINSAHAISLYKLAKTIGCKMEDLLEF